MRLAADVQIPFPRPIVFATYRDKLIELVPFLANVQQIEIKSRREEVGLIHFVNEWHGGGEIPAIARALISESLLTWTDFATWNEAEFTTKWRIETHAFTEAVYCAGSHQFLETNGGTLIKSRGDLIIDPNKVKGVPSFLAGTVAQTVEEILSQKVAPNLQQVGEGVRHYLEQQ